jgi:hypothetical protein
MISGPHNCLINLLQMQLSALVCSLCCRSKAVYFVLAFAGSSVTLQGTVTNLGNIKLQNLHMWPTPDIDVSPICSVSTIDDVNSTATTWQEPGEVPVGKVVVCTVTYTLGQDALETMVTSTSGMPEVHMQLSANATATAAQQHLTGSASVTILVTQTTSLAVQILSGQCQVPQEPGKLGDTF